MGTSNRQHRRNRRTEQQGSNSSSAHEEQSTLLRLPAELRNAIYTYVFAENARLDEYGAIVDSDFDRNFTFYSLTLANRQIHRETLESCYQYELGLRLLQPLTSRDAASRWYRKLSGPLRARLSSFEFSTDPYWDGYDSVRENGLVLGGTWEHAYEDFARAVYRNSDWRASDYSLGWRIKIGCGGVRGFSVEMHYV